MSKRDMNEFETRDGKVVINTIEDLDKFEAKHFPDGIKAKRKRDFFDDGEYSGHNLSRFGYTDLLAAECHALRDLIQGLVGYSYGFPFDPHVKTHKDDDGNEWYEVYTF